MNEYHEHVMEHYRSPRNKGTVANATLHFHDSNPLCGDMIDITLRVVDGRIVAARHDTRGCAISQAGASMLFETLEGKTVAEALTIDKNELLESFGTTLSVSRVKCALLALSALKKGLVEGEHHARNN